ncbi:MAG: hypothetical protein P4M01_12275 [Acidobacteriota bacterium]|nr:hypothetical protein [Acidobacteriota bacterium]
MRFVEKPFPSLRPGRSQKLARRVALFLFTVLLFAAPSLPAQGGPPLLTDDPGTPGRNNWEINVGYIQDRSQGDNDYEAPILDLNYGWGDRVQLKYEMPYVFNSTDNGKLQGGPGDSKFGVKYRFLQNVKLNLDIGTYPQLEINNTQESVKRNLVYKGPQFLLPLEITKKAGPVDLDIEVGHWFTQQMGYWIAGLAASHQATKKLEVLSEVYSNGSPFGERDNTFDFGGRYRLNRNALFIFMAGRSFSPPSSGQSQFIGYFGMQFQLGRHLREE